MRVLVTDGNERSALAVTRALGQKGLQVVVGAETDWSLASASKYCWRSFSYPSPYVDGPSTLVKVLEVVKDLRVDAVFPISDAVILLMAPYRQEFVIHTKLAVPETETFETLSNKYRLMQLAAELGIPIPETVFVPDGCLKKAASSIRQFPVVVKPGQSVVRVNGHLQKTGVHYAASEAELDHLYNTIDYLGQPSLIQRRIEGEGQGIFALLDQGKPVALFAHRRLREKPPSGGVSVLRESVALPQPMTDYALRLLRHVGWHGVAMVEFKVDRQSGVPLLLEVNARFWGSLQLALDAGINFPWLLYRMTMGEELQLPVNGYRIGVKSRWLLGDLDHLLLRLSKPDDELSLSPHSPTKLKTLLEFCRFYQLGMRNEVLRFDDPKPFARELGRYIADLLRTTSSRHPILSAAMDSAKAAGRYLRDPQRLMAHCSSRLGFGSHKIRQALSGRIHSVLFVCQGNVCRSPLAAAYFDSRLREQGCPIEVRSAGLDTTPGKEAHPLASAVARENNLSLETHVTRSLNQELVDRADLILVMEYVHVSTLLQRHPQAAGKVVELGYFKHSLSTEIADPFSGTKADFEICYKAIGQSCDNLLKTITRRASVDK